MISRQRKTSNLWEFPIPAHTNNMLSLSRIHVTPFTPKTPLLRQSKQWLSSHMLSSPYRSSPHSHHESCHKATVLFISRRSWRGTPASSWWVCGGASVLRRHVWRSMRGGGKKWAVNHVVGRRKRNKKALRRSAACLGGENFHVIWARCRYVWFRSVCLVCWMDKF